MGGNNSIYQPPILAKENRNMKSTKSNSTLRKQLTVCYALDIRRTLNSNKEKLLGNLDASANFPLGYLVTAQKSMKSTE